MSADIHQTRNRRRIRPYHTIGAKLAIAFLLPTAVVFAPLAILAYRTASTELEAELGKRLAAVAAAAATQVRGRNLADLESGDEARRPYQSVQKRLDAVRMATQVERISVFSKDFASLCDTDPTPIGTRYYLLETDRSELEQMFRSGAPFSSTLFDVRGRKYKAGYAPVVMSPEEDPTLLGGIRVEAPAEHFDRLVTLQEHIKTYSLVVAGLYIAASLVVAALIVRPIRRLTQTAARIGKGDLTAPVDVRGRDEITFLAHTILEMRDAIRQRNERMQMMLAGIAHEVRNPLGGIELYSGILREECAKDAEKTSHIQRIEREIGHLKAVVNDFLDYARRPKPEPVVTAVAPFLVELRDLCLGEAQTSGVRLTVACPEDLHVAFDPTQLRRALLNLVKNAVQATPKGGEVFIEARREGVTALLRVSDTGAGIPPEHCDQIFAPFFTTKEKGTGLGLAFVREIVADHNGGLHIESELGRGTTFTITLAAPIEKPQQRIAST